MLDLSLLCSLSVIAITTWLFLRRQRRSRILRKLPRPQSTKFILGNTLDLIKYHRHDFHDWLLHECERHQGNPWLLSSLGRPPAIVLGKESHFEDILRRQFSIFTKGSSALTTQDFFGQGIFAVDGDAWYRQRKTASHLFTHQMIRECMEEAIREETGQVLAILRKSCESHEQVDFKNLMDNLTTDVFTRIGFGVRLGSLQDHQHQAEFHQAFTRCPISIQSRFQQPGWLWRFKRMWSLGSEKVLKKDLTIVNEKIYQIITDSIKEKTRSATAPRNDLISLFLDKSADEKVDPKMIRDMSLNFIAAGRGTTAQSLVWFIVMMNRYPDVLKKIQAELDTKLPDLQTTDRVPSMKEVQQLVYLEAAIKESLRLNPAAPLNGRTATTDTALSDGTLIPEGTTVLIPTYASARFKWLWGEDAAEFKPERWIDDTTGKLIQISPFKYLVFHAGPRICLGVKLAMLEMKIAIAAMLGRFELQTTQDPFKVTYDLSLSLPIKDDLYVTVQHRKVKVEAVAQSAAIVA